MAKRTRTSKAWMHQHVSDAYVRAARREGYRSRAAYKLMEIDERGRLLRPGLLVVDLGAAPGGWSQVARERVGAKGRVIAIDLLAMEPLPGVEFVQGDFSGGVGLAAVEQLLAGSAPDVVISDMAPNISGIPQSDQARALALAELAGEFAAQRLKPGGALLVKAFQGEGFDELVRFLRTRFGKVVVRKPGASRSRSSEVYLLATAKLDLAGSAGATIRG